MFLNPNEVKIYYFFFFLLQFIANSAFQRLATKIFLCILEYTFIRGPYYNLRYFFGKSSLDQPCINVSGKSAIKVLTPDNEFLPIQSVHQFWLNSIYFLKRNH